MCVLTRFVDAEDAPDVSIQVSQDALNSAGQVYFAAGALDYSGELSINHQVQTTSVFETVLPKAFTLCKNCPLEFHVKATSAPSVAIDSSEAVASVNDAYISMAAKDSKGVNHELLQLAWNASCGLNFSTVPKSSGSFLAAKLSILRLHTRVTHSDVGLLPYVAVPVLDLLVQHFLTLVVVPAFNTFFPGFPIPWIPNVFVFSKVLVTTKSGFIGVSFDFNPPPPPPPKCWSREGVICEAGPPGSPEHHECCKGFECVYKNLAEETKYCHKLPPPGQCVKGDGVCETGNSTFCNASGMCCCAGAVCIDEGQGYFFCGHKNNSNVEAMETTPQQNKSISASPAIVRGTPLGFSGPGVTITIAGNAFNKILSPVLDAIRNIFDELPAIQIPKCYRDSCAIDSLQYQIDPIKINGLNWKPDEAFVHPVAGKGIQIDFNSDGAGLMSYIIPAFGLEIKRNTGPVKLHCSGTASMSMDDMNIVQNLLITTKNNKPYVTPTNSIDWGVLVGVCLFNFRASFTCNTLLH